MKAFFRALWGVVFLAFLIIGAYGVGGGYAVVLTIGILGMCGLSISIVTEAIGPPATLRSGPKERSEPHWRASKARWIN